ncbi:MAG: uL15 family ribosomal protein [Candidatus Diapherotrites archaeon]|nr:uL15 family ribosomal protein [Candidatus Diapherotrites archaeon]
MVERKRKKKNRLRGQRTMGKGDTKNKRGAGTRGGRGRAGSGKHERNLYFHEVGALRKLKPKKKGLALNLKDINRMLEELGQKKETEKEEGLIVFDGKKTGVKKILSTGHLVHKAVFKNVTASKKAIEKIGASGSKIENQKETFEEAEQ